MLYIRPPQKKKKLNLKKKHVIYLNSIQDYLNSYIPLVRIQLFCNLFGNIYYSNRYTLLPSNSISRFRDNRNAYTIQQIHSDKLEFL